MYLGKKHVFRKVEFKDENEEEEQKEPPCHYYYDDLDINSCHRRWKQLQIDEPVA